ncbi:MULTISPECIES: hypothetical protein [unclassified Nostoc]|uniref:hypothetical protein n=1 Tax=unclassified Nostoc TaxID=2593658 RepID=UPI002AD39DB7|nr:hypothetical protein [Nostoc sp. DedQUE03]MDZ7975450.1 hypothetical protein [Nostoc sp. DedQUE03]MDZ8045498.1 hypothetical protein [Nostoc sp. DedQUE02]
MKVNQWINQKFWQSIFISLAPSGLDIAIALKVVLKHNWLAGKISRTHSWAKPELIAPIANQKTSLLRSIYHFSKLIELALLPLISKAAILKQPSIWKFHSIYLLTLGN